MVEAARFTGLEMRPAEELPEGTPLIEGAAQLLRRARELPIGGARNALRRLARVMIKLHRIGYRDYIEIMEKPTIH
ncbi:hypothetical protein ABIF65_006616 [Bradyrhizobium japonicum]|jgi:hypothetical protein|uniref:hypothetical protein n=1 Tax=Bradyrhizobium TaxID=374 RepID=UPI0004B8C215|nr:MULTISPECIES: hypothetical protein [Bradyrhizobium]MBR0883751.1 hypothetical protein [Bradyrhizobium liaoningense]MBR0947846.1 hypothetical protein [Bradyrhizobium liaoningense]MBR1003834.1 hypothetical protein [Bradyrhizobium liaoningense]MBR1032715.1 hypothetical protein [Bradyrhizobium liaoningense]MBR1070109.1 hypothetical protein [Bradyrhizobium liaoningense]